MQVVVLYERVARVVGGAVEKQPVAHSLERVAPALTKIYAALASVGTHDFYYVARLLRVAVAHRSLHVHKVVERVFVHSLIIGLRIRQQHFVYVLRNGNFVARLLLLYAYGNKVFSVLRHEVGCAVVFVECVRARSAVVFGGVNSFGFGAVELCAEEIGLVVLHRARLVLFVVGRCEINPVVVDEYAAVFIARRAYALGSYELHVHSVFFKTVFVYNLI